ncbi:hypothetical protein CcCBS67573_g06445 [Chytriomyces confervae]|uniref:F-box domain-containing protein n=1 Tax=Chytriomyces confervae TaxID=246404 RepID=A0A507F5U3_9FUNG|nr:hypothetical protein CcCBS67573_g06445 [Chytriomyces confervae]
MATHLSGSSIRSSSGSHQAPHPPLAAAVLRAASAVPLVDSVRQNKSVICASGAAEWPVPEAPEAPPPNQIRARLPLFSSLPLKMKLRRVSAPQMAHILELPVELLQRIFRYVHPAQVVKYRRVCLRIFSALSTGAFARENLQMHPKLTAAGADKVSARAVKLLLRWPIEYQAAFAAFAQQAAATKMCCGWRRLDGAVPSALGDWPALTHLELQENKLRGELPIALGLLAGLRVLHLNGNSLSGAIPHELGRLEKLEQLHLNDNCLSGSIPDSLGQLCQLQSLYLNNNCLSGQLPPTLGKLNNLRALYLENNQIEGFIPLEWANMARLQIAYLGRNRLNPCLPSGFGRSTHIGEILRHQGFRCALQVYS